MLLNKFEYLAMNNPIRAYIQEQLEIKNLRKLSRLDSPQNVLEIGCGWGNGSKLIKRYFNPKSIQAIDLDKRMINSAIKRNKDSSTHFQVADATKLPFPDNTFDAVFDFGIIHHIPNWQECLQELKRVLKPDGELLLEDLSIETFNTATGRLLKIMTMHPYDRMYTRQEFFDHIEKLGFEIKIKKVYKPLGLITYFNVIAIK